MPNQTLEAKIIDEVVGYWLENLPLKTTRLEDITQGDWRNLHKSIRSICQEYAQSMVVEELEALKSYGVMWEQIDDRIKEIKSQGSKEDGNG